MTVVVLLGNMWQWSGGFASYVSWVTGETAPPMRAGASDDEWQAHQAFAIRFYSLPEARALYYRYVRSIASRVNTLTGVRYANDPTIFAWELANEPRPLSQVEAYRAWIDEAAAVVRASAPHHMVALGSEGPTPWPGYVRTSLLEDHKVVDYVAIHVWPQNWLWYDPVPAMEASEYSSEHSLGGGLGASSGRTLGNAMKMSATYIDEAARIAMTLRKPLVVEEFGLAREGGVQTPGTSTESRDFFYRWVCKHAADTPPIAGLNFWAWSGEGRAGQLLGDPPHEPQGWYSVFDTDAGTHAAIFDCSQRMLTSNADGDDALLRTQGGAGSVGMDASEGQVISTSPSLSPSLHASFEHVSGSPLSSGRRAYRRRHEQVKLIDIHAQRLDAVKEIGGSSSMGKTWSLAPPPRVATNWADTTEGTHTSEHQPSTWDSVLFPSLRGPRGGIARLDEHFASRHDRRVMAGNLVAFMLSGCFVFGCMAVLYQLVKCMKRRRELHAPRVGLLRHSSESDMEGDSDTESWHSTGGISFRRAQARTSSPSWAPIFGGTRHDVASHRGCCER
eukprot:scaffold6668_cov30-Tisochrysis_lutea.AAC.1